MEKQYIYIISNPAFKGWYKIGRTTNPVRRLMNYQTYSPFRDYIISYILEVKNPNLHEKFFKDSSEGEWIKCRLNKLISIINVIEFGGNNNYFEDLKEDSKKKNNKPFGKHVKSNSKRVVYTKK